MAFGGGANQQARQACRSLAPQRRRLRGGRGMQELQAFRSCLSDHGVKLPTPTPARRALRARQRTPGRRSYAGRRHVRPVRHLRPEDRQGGQDLPAAAAVATPRPSLLELTLRRPRAGSPPGRGSLAGAAPGGRSIRAAPGRLSRPGRSWRSRCRPGPRVPCTTTGRTRLQGLRLVDFLAIVTFVEPVVFTRTIPLGGLDVDVVAVDELDGARRTAAALRLAPAPPPRPPSGLRRRSRR